MGGHLVEGLVVHVLPVHEDRLLLDGLNCGGVTDGVFGDWPMGVGVVL